MHTYAPLCPFKFLSIILLEIWAFPTVRCVDCIVVGLGARVVRQMVCTLSTREMNIAHSSEILVAADQTTLSDITDKGNLQYYCTCL